MFPFKRFLASLLVASTALAGLPMQAHAALITTDDVLAAEASLVKREKVSAFLAREDVQQALRGQGVSEQAVVDRVQAMTDAEVAQLAGEVDRAPAGGDVLGMAFTIFIILLVTDILGLTKVFPFTRSINHR